MFVFYTRSSWPFHHYVEHISSTFCSDWLISVGNQRLHVYHCHFLLKELIFPELLKMISLLKVSIVELAYTLLDKTRLAICWFSRACLTGRWVLTRSLTGTNPATACFTANTPRCPRCPCCFCKYTCIKMLDNSFKKGIYNKHALKSKYTWDKGSIQQRTQQT